MTIQEATVQRIREICHERKVSEYRLISYVDMPPSTVKSIMSGKIKNPGILNIAKLAGGLEMTVREFYDSDLFDNLG